MYVHHLLINAIKFAPRKPILVSLGRENYARRWDQAGIQTIFILLLLMGCNRFTSWHTPEGGDFLFQSTKGELNTKNLRGKTYFLFFGFLQCPHVCPTTIRELNRVAKDLTPLERERAAFLFISVDPRDSLAVLSDYFREKDPLFLAAPGNGDQLQMIMKLFGATFHIIKGKDPTDIFIDHTSSVFVINPDGVWVDALPFDSTKEEFKRAFLEAPTKKPFGSGEELSKIRVLGFNEKCDLNVSPCDFVGENGDRYGVEISPRPIRHLQRSQVIIRTTNSKLTPKLADLVGVELPMGFMRPVLVKKGDTWVGDFTLPLCDLKAMNWHLRLLLQDAEKANSEIRFQFSSVID